MSNLSDFIGGSKPKLITTYNTGTGTYFPTADMARCFIRLQGAGGSAGYEGGYQGGGGGGGAMVEFFVRVPIAGIAYIVGAGGAPVTVFGNSGRNGSSSTFGLISAQGGWGGVAGTSSGSGVSTGGSVGAGMSGLSGSAGGQPAGFPSSTVSRLGGSSFLGSGGAIGAAGTGYGSGSGSAAAPSSAGQGGYIEIWDYGV